MITVVASLKGGSGKSTVTFNLAVWLALAGVSVQVFDLDPQATLTDVIAVRRQEGFKPVLAVQNQVAELLATSQSKTENTEILVDVGTADMAALTQALALAQRILIPVPPSQADVWSTQRFLKMIQNALPDATKWPAIYAFINRADTHHAVKESDETAAALVTLAQIKLLKPRLGQRTIFRQSFSEGLAVFELDNRNKASREFLALAATIYQHVIAT